MIDFGIAQITEGTGTLTNSTIETPMFMAPEQIAHGSATPASDVFAWGAVLVFAATGASPFNGNTIPNVLHNVLNTVPDLSALPEELRPLVAAALAKDPAARPSAVDVLMRLLGRQGRPTDATSLTQAMHEARTAVLDGGNATGATTRDTVPGEDFSSRNKRARRLPRWLIAVVAVLAALALLGTGMLLGDIWGANGQDGTDGTDSESSQFSDEEAGSWEGLTDSGNPLEVQIEAGEPTAELEVPDEDNCSAQIRLLDSSEASYQANITFVGTDREPFRCVSNESWNFSDEVELTVDGDTMTIDIFAEHSLSGEKMDSSTFVLSRTG